MDNNRYTVDEISGLMSLRKPQYRSLEILADILERIEIGKQVNLQQELDKLKEAYPTCVDFERDFVSLSFVLATGTGKTRLIGTFITYLYNKYGYRNFFVVAPNTTIYNKLRADLGDPTNPKYVFNGVSCFEDNAPRVLTDYDCYNYDFGIKQNIMGSDVNIYIYNISKFDKEAVRMKAFNEVLGNSLYKELSELEDLVVIMDEAHHYHGAKGSQAINELKPILGLELTATPYYNKGSRQVMFRNVVYEYSLAESISDGYTRTPYAITRSDVNFSNYSEAELDRLMLEDGILCHENTKQQLELYTRQNNLRYVKPFLMVVCRDTEHANQILNYVTSNEFCNGRYRNKAIAVHSNLKKNDKDGVIEMLLEVEDPYNTVEIVIHVDMLKEGWDVNNLYTIVPLRTAASRILREQMVGRGLRLPFGKRTGDKAIDAVMLTAHDKFDELLAEAQKGDSIFKAGNVIDTAKLAKQEIEEAQLAISLEHVNEQVVLLDDIAGITGEAQKELLNIINSTVQAQYFNYSEANNSSHEYTEELTPRFVVVPNSYSSKGQLDNPVEFTTRDTESRTYPTESEEYVKYEVVTTPRVQQIQQNVQQKVFEQLKENSLLAHLLDSEQTLAKINQVINNNVKVITNKFINLPVIHVSQVGVREQRLIEFTVELNPFNHVPVSETLLVQNLENQQEKFTISRLGKRIAGFDPVDEIKNEFINLGQIAYGEDVGDIIHSLITQVVHHYQSKYSESEVQNIISANKRDIAHKLMLQATAPKNFYFVNSELVEEVTAFKNNSIPKYTSSVQLDLFKDSEEKFGEVLYTGITKGVFAQAKFNSRPELVFARILETDELVCNWLRPQAQDLQLVYNKDRKYIPDFIVETDQVMYLVEIKGDDRLTAADVIAKKERAVSYCEMVTRTGKRLGGKEWRYLFIPASEIKANSTFANLAERFTETA